jgi:hypothetical protein
MPLAWTTAHIDYLKWYMEMLRQPAEGGGQGGQKALPAPDQMPIDDMFAEPAGGDPLAMADYGMPA